MNNLSIKTRLFLGFGLVVVLFLGYVGFSIYTLNTVQGEVDNLAKERIPMMQDMNRWAMDAADARRYAAMALIRPETVDERIKQVDAKLVEIEKLFVAYGEALEKRDHVRAEAKALGGLSGAAGQHAEAGQGRPGRGGQEQLYGAGPPSVPRGQRAGPEDAEDQ